MSLWTRICTVVEDVKSLVEGKQDSSHSCTIPISNGKPRVDHACLLVPVLYWNLALSRTAIHHAFAKTAGLRKLSTTYSSATLDSTGVQLERGIKLEPSRCSRTCNQVVAFFYSFSLSLSLLEFPVFQVCTENFTVYGINLLTVQNRCVITLLRGYVIYPIRPQCCKNNARGQKVVNSN